MAMGGSMWSRPTPAPTTCRSCSAPERARSREDLGGAGAQHTKSGVAHFSSPNERESIHAIRELLSFLPSNNMEDPPFRPNGDDPNRRDEQLNSLIPDNPNKP